LECQQKTGEWRIFHKKRSKAALIKPMVEQYTSGFGVVIKDLYDAKSYYDLVFSVT